MRYQYGMLFSLSLLLFSTTMPMRCLRGDEQAGKVSASNPSKEPIDLFNGKDLDGWKPIGKARWEVKGGLLIGRQGPNGGAGDLLTDVDYDDFELVISYRVKWPANSGVWFRYQSDKQAYQADILEHKDPIAYSGSLYCMGKKFIAVNDNSKLVHREGWNKMVILAQSNRIVIHINEKKVADVRDDSSTYGKIGLQVHRGDDFTGMQIIVKEFQLRPL